MPKIIAPGKRLTADVTHRIEPPIKVKDTEGETWYARTLFLDLDRGKGNEWQVKDFRLSIAKKLNYAFYTNAKLGKTILLEQNPKLAKLVDKYVAVVKSENSHTSDSR